MLWPYLVLLAEVLLFYRKVLFSGGAYLIPWDLQFYHQPLAWFAMRSLGRGELPLWDPYSYCGMPTYANLTVQLFYPPTTLLYLAANWIGDGRHLLYLLEVHIALHVLLAGILTLLLLRRLGAGTAGALAGATVYQLGAYFTSQAQHLGAINAAAWLPLCWLAVIELSRGYRGRWVAVLAAALSLSFLSGFPATTAAVFGTTALLALALAVTKRAHWSALAWCGAAMGIAALVCAVQLLPTMELSRQSVAALRADWMEAGGGIPLAALPTLAAPDWHGVFQFTPGTWKLPWNPTFLYLYCGIPALLFALLALVWRRHACAAAFACVTLAAAFWMLGDSTPVYRTVFRLLPDKLKSGLYAEFALCAFTLGLAVLAGLGADAWLRGRGRLLQAVVITAIALDLTLAGSGRPMNTMDARHEPGIGYDHYDRFPQIPRRLRELVNATSPPWRTDTMGGSILWSGAANLFEVPTASGDDPFALVRYMQVRESFTGGERWGRYYEVRDPDSPILKLLNVRYVISNGRLPAPGRLMERDDLPGNQVYENPDPLPRFFLVGRVRRASGMEEAIRTLRRPDFDVRSEAIVEGVEGTGAHASVTGTVRTISYGAREVVLETDAAGPCFLVTSEAWYPGWRAELDGRAAPLVLTNAAFRGMAVPAGRHRVRMRFAPAILWQSGLVSLVGIGLIFGLALGDNRRSRERWTSSSS